MRNPRRRANRRWVLAMAASLGVVAMGTACTRDGSLAGSAGPVAAASVTTSAAISTATSAAGPATDADIASEQWGAPRGRAVSALLERRFADLARGDRTGWLDALGGSPSGQLQEAQGAVFDRMVAMRVGDLRLVGVRETTPPVPAARDSPVEWDVRASLTYQLRGFDSSPRSFDLDVTLRAEPAAPSRVVIIGSSPSGRPQPWDLAGLVVRRSASSLVLAVGPSERVDELVRRAGTAAARVAAVWGEVKPAVWVAPSSDADAARLLGRDAGDLGGVAAATDGPLTPGEPAGADRIVLVPAAWTSLRPEGRDVVMTHELTHVTVRGSTTRAVPLWLSEGFAELVAYRDVDLPEASIVATALERVRAGGLPGTLPEDADFRPGTPGLSAAYGLSMLAVRTLGDAYGTQAVVHLYRGAAGGLPQATDRLDDHESTVDEALHAVMGTSRPALVADWQARLRGLLG